MPTPNVMPPFALMDLIGTPFAPVILDVSTDTDFADDPHFVPTAIRQPVADLVTLAPGLVGKRVVVVCQKGRKLSLGAAALLRSCGVTALALEGGNYGWRDADLPRIPAAAIPARSNGATQWVTAQRPGQEILACAWLIRRFIDPLARFMFVPEDDATDVAGKFDAVLFGIDDSRQPDGVRRGPFDRLIASLAVSHAPLERLATVIRAAGKRDQPHVGGWWAVADGLSRLHKDDMQLLNAALPLYDALYAWADGTGNGTTDQGA